jgi:hypothetical protein
MRALKSAHLGGGEPDSLAAGMTAHTPVPGNGRKSRSADAVHSDWGRNGESGAGAHVPVDERSDSPNNMRGG